MCGLRCKACNARLTYFDTTVMKSDTLPEPEDLCGVCRAYSYIEDWPKEYAFEEITERLIDYDLEKELDENY